MLPSTAAQPSPAKRIDALFARLTATKRKALVTFLVGCDPDFAESLATMHAFVESGIDLIELGYPFSDPILDGATIQRANRRGLDSGGHLARTLELVAAFRQTDQTTPIILMGYSNPILAMGYAEFTRRAAEAGVDGVIAADMPLREAGEFLDHLAAAGMVMIPLAAPTLDEADFALRPGVGGFLYCIPVVGPTGGPSASLDATRQAVERCRKATTLPILVGFGIKTPEAAADTASVADGSVVASALIDIVRNLPPESGSSERIRTYRESITAFRSAIDALSL